MMKKMLFLIAVSQLFILYYSKGQEGDFLIETYKEHKGKVEAVAFSKSGKYLASGGEDKILVIRDINAPHESKEFDDNYYPIKDMEFYGDNQLFVSAGRDIKLIDLDNNTLALYRGAATNIWSLDFAPERNKLTAGAYDKTLRIWDVKSTEILFELEGHEKSALSIVFSGDEKYLVSGSRDQTIKVWNAQTGALLNSFERHSGNIFDVKFHPDTRYFASASGDKTIRLWDIVEGKVVKTYVGHDGSVLDIEFSPDGYYMYSTGVDGTIYVWEVATGKKLYSYVLHEGSVNTIDVSSDGFYVASGGDDGLVMLWKSAKYIVVETFMADELNSAKSSNPVFEEKLKGESKDAFHARESEAKEVERGIVNTLYNKYISQNSLKKTP